MKRSLSEFRGLISKLKPSRLVPTNRKGPSQGCTKAVGCVKEQGRKRACAEKKGKRLTLLTKG